MEEDKIIEIRKEKVMTFLKEKSNWISYILLAIIVYIAVMIRTLNLKGLRDITTGQWTLGPDLDPFLFLRWAKEIVQHGSLYMVDKLRYYPLGYDTKREVLLHPYLIAWFHNVATFFGSTSVEQSAVLFPVFFFAITVIVFFFLVRKIFDGLGETKANAIALISSFFLSVLPSILPRTIAGIPEKEATGFFFLFLSFYLFLSAWKSKKLYWMITLGILSGISTALMAFVWGGYIYVFLTLSLAILMAFMMGQINRNYLWTIISWLGSSFLVISQFSERYSLSTLLNSSTTIIPLGVLFMILVHYLVFGTKIKNYLQHPKLAKIPKPVLSIITTVILGAILVSIAFGPGFIIDKIGDVTKPLITPTTDRVGVTVAENKQPYFGEWSDNFGPNSVTLFGQTLNVPPLFFWLFFIGSIYLYYYMINMFSKKERLVITASYIVFLFAIIFSRYSPDSTLNGTNGFSILVYVIGMIALISGFGYYYFKYHKEGAQDKLRSVDFGFVMIFALFFFSIISARGAVRLVMVMVPSASILAGFLVVELSSFAYKVRKTHFRNLAWLAVALVVLCTLLSAYSFYTASSGEASTYYPNIYTQQWQKAMSWVRTSTPETAVFAHWWDYGYWLQSIGDRATIVDGGNSIPYWDYLMGRHALTGQSDSEALDFLYAHNTTHFLIDSTDIGKYPAFSSIGSDQNYDRYSWIPAFALDTKQSQEKKNSTVMVYSGGTYLDEDIIYDLNGTKVFLPAQKAGIGAVVIEKDKRTGNISQPLGVFVYQNTQYTIPLRYGFVEGKGLVDFGSGIEAGVFRIPSFDGSSVVKDGALLFLSKRVVHTQLARLYLYNENDPYFKLVHSEDDFLIAQIKAQNISSSDFIYYGGIRGPIRIWEIHYPDGMSVNPVYLQTDYPDLSVTKVQ